MSRALLPSGHPGSCSCPASYLVTVLRPVGSWPEGPFRVTYCRYCGCLTFTREVAEGHPKDWLETVGFEAIRLEPVVARWLCDWAAYPASFPSDPAPDSLPPELSYFREFWRVVQCDEHTPTRELIACAALDQAAFALVAPLLRTRADLEETICLDVEAPGVLALLFPLGMRSARVLDALMTQLEEIGPEAIHRAERLCLALEGLQAVRVLPRLTLLVQKQAWGSRYRELLARCVERLRA